MHNITITKGYEKTDIQFQNKFWINFFPITRTINPKKVSFDIHVSRKPW